MNNGIYDTSSILYVQNAAIDKVKWDRCIDTAPNGLIYAYSFYLDAMAKHWDALVLNDYEAVMPLTWNKKYGICYLYQPFLCASLGLFGKNISGEMLSMFLNKIPSRFKYWDIYLNSGNLYSIQQFNLYKRINYTLNINNSYPTLFNNFRNSYKQIIKKSTLSGLEIKQNINVEEITSLAENKLQTISKIKKRDTQNFVNLYKSLSTKRKAINYGVYLKDELLASGIFLFSHNRAYYVLAGNKTKGRALGASHLVINSFIKQHAETNMILDFEGSNVKEIAFFFKGFGAQPEEYPGLKLNALPPIIRAFKK
jgi:hypothetical protein